MTCKGPLQTSHIVSRRYHAVRWNLDNAEAACARCHRMQHDFPAMNGLRLRQKLGEEKIEELYREARKVERVDLESIYARLKEGE